jgi:hypothetical protein
VSCTNWLLEFCSPHKDKCFDGGRKLLREKQQYAEENIRIIFRSLQLRLLSLLGWNVMYLQYILNVNVYIASLFWISSTVLIYLSCFLNSQDIFKKRHLSLHSGIYPCQTAASLPACPGETPQRQIFRRPVSQRLSLLQILCTQLNKVET